MGFKSNIGDVEIQYSRAYNLFFGGSLACTQSVWGGRGHPQTRFEGTMSPNGVFLNT